MFLETTAVVTTCAALFMAKLYADEHGKLKEMKRHIDIMSLGELIPTTRVPVDDWGDYETTVCIGRDVILIPSGMKSVLYVPKGNISDLEKLIPIQGRSDMLMHRAVNKVSAALTHGLSSWYEIGAYYASKLNKYASYKSFGTSVNDEYILIVVPV